MTPRHRSFPVVLLAVSSTLLTGCLERFETIKIDDTGAAALTCAFRGDPTDVTSGDPLPELGSAWKVSDTQDKDKDGHPRLTRTASLDIAPGQPIPDSYTTPDDPRYAVGLRFPTAVTVERRTDGVYYHFKRTYIHRDDARYTWVRRTLDETPELKALKAKDPAKLTSDERGKLIDAFKMIEIDKQLHFVDAGLATLTDRPQDVGLKVRDAVVHFGDAYETRALVDLLSKPESAERDASINQIAQSFLSGARRAAEQALLRSGLTVQEQKAFLYAFDVEASRRAITEDLSDEKWEVRVTLPGQIVASNADQTEGSTAVWAFPAGAIMDRDQVLMVTSKVDRSK